MTRPHPSTPGSPLRTAVGVLGALVLSFSWVAGVGAQEPMTGGQLGPKEGSDLPPTELDRVAVGTLAPDFTLRTLREDPITLSDFRGEKNVVLVFYRGHW